MKFHTINKNLNNRVVRLNKTTGNLVNNTKHSFEPTSRKSDATSTKVCDSKLRLLIMNWECLVSVPNNN